VEAEAPEVLAEAAAVVAVEAAVALVGEAVAAAAAPPVEAGVAVEADRKSVV